ncbi:MAG: yrrC [Chlamydiia bacterium]|nr:yrrC [Chlamydiia bacterium]
MQELTGCVERLTYYDKESHFVVAAMHVTGTKKQEVVITGVMPGIQVGETIHCQGEWKRHDKHGVQFEVTTFKLELPKNAQAIEKFLGSGAVKGVGAGYAARIVAKFGDKTLDIIDKEPDRLQEVEGLGQKRIDALQESWKEHQALQEVFIFLHGYGISRAYAKRILRTYGHKAMQAIKENPYQLAKDVNGIGFTHADAIAKHLGFTHDSVERIQAGISYVLNELAGNGHVCHPLDAFSKLAQETLQVPDESIRQHVGKLFQQGEVELRTLREDALYVWTKPLYVCEQGISSEIKRLIVHPSAMRDIVVDKAIEWAEEKQKIQFAPHQKEALAQVLTKKFSIVTGGPGTGKSTITKAIVGISSKLTKKIMLAAPTGRAAKRLTEITSCYASTIHRILKFDFTQGKFKYDRDNPLDVDLLIVDESSMIDTYLMYQLLRAVPNTARVIIIGDANQLPSIGPGTVLRDLIAAEKIPVTKLSVIFRQASHSKIIVNAHRINEGEMPYTKNFENSDFYFFEAQEPEAVRESIIDLVTTKIPEKFGFDPKKEIQVLVPMRKGPCGIEILNRDLQEKLTPGDSIGQFRVGDKVMQLKNNYSKDVFNGDIGIITHIDSDAIIVDIDDKSISYTSAELDELTLAYAVSVHKYQGSECPAIVMPVHTVHFKLLTRNLLYTGVTRGRKLVCLVGTKKALAIAVKNQEVATRFTGLPEALQSIL